MGLKVAELYATLGLDDKEFQKGLTGTESSFGKLGSTLGSLAIKAGAGIATAFGAGAVASGVAFMGFEKQMNEVFTLLPDISDKAMGDMTRQVKDFSKEFGTLPNEVVPALYQAISAGVPQSNVFEFLEVAQKSAKGGVTDLATAVDGISSVVNAYGADVIDASKASDLMFTAVKNGKTNFEQLSSSIYNVTPVASAMGVSFEDVTAGLASITAQGVPTTVATTQMRAMFAELGKDTTGISKIFKELSGKSFQEFIAEGNNVQDVLQLLEGYAKENKISMVDLFGSIEAGQGALALTGKGTETFTKNLQDMANASGATEQAFERMDQGIGASFDKIKTAIYVAGLDLAEKFAPTVQNVADRIVELMPLIQEKVQTAFDAIGVAINAVSGTLKFLKENADIIVPAITAMAGVIMAVMLPALYAKATAMWAVATASITAFAPVIAIIVAVGVVVAGLAYIWKKYGDEIKQTISAMAKYTVDKWNGLVDFTKSSVSNMWSTVSSKFSQMGQSVTDRMNGIKQSIVNIWNGARNFLSSINLFQIGKDIMQGLLNGIANMATAVWNKAKEIANGVGDTIKKALRISSPSKITTQLGKWTGIGMVDGLDDTKDMISRKANELATASVPMATNPRASNEGTITATLIRSLKDMMDKVQLQSEDRDIVLNFYGDNILSSDEDIEETARKLGDNLKYKLRMGGVR